MSATLSVETFVDFFADLRRAGVNGQPPDRDPKSCVRIEGRMFPVKEHFLEDACVGLGWVHCVDRIRLKPQASP